MEKLNNEPIVVITYENPMSVPDVEASLDEPGEAALVEQPQWHPSAGQCERDQQRVDEDGRTRKIL